MERAERMILLGIGFLSAVVPRPRAVDHAGPDHGHRGRAVRQGVAAGRGPGPGGRPASTAGSAAPGGGERRRCRRARRRAGGPAGRASWPAARVGPGAPGTPARACVSAPARRQRLSRVADGPVIRGGRGLVEQGTGGVPHLLPAGRVLGRAPRAGGPRPGPVVGDAALRGPGRPAGHGRRATSAVCVGAGDDAVPRDRWARRSFRAYARYWVEGARLGATPPPRSTPAPPGARGSSNWRTGWPPERASSWPCRTSGAGSTAGRSWPRDGCPMTAVAERIEPPGAVRLLRRPAGGHGAHHRPARAPSPGPRVLATLAPAGWSGC